MILFKNENEKIEYNKYSVFEISYNKWKNIIKQIYEGSLWLYSSHRKKTCMMSL